MKNLRIFYLVVLASIFIFSCEKKPYLIGYYNNSQDYIQACTTWRTTVKENFKPNPVYMDSISMITDSVDCEIYTNTNCLQSKVWLPRFFKIQKDLPIKNMFIAAVDSSKKDEKGILKQKNITKIPSFLFYRDGKEIGRIEEKPQKPKNLEINIYRIIKPKN